MELADKETLQGWLTLQSGMVAGVRRAVIIARSTGTDSGEPLACWPEKTRIPEAMPAAAVRALRENCEVRQSLAEQPPDESPPSDIVAMPVLVDGKILCALAVELARRPDQQMQAALRVFSWGAAWLGLLVKNRAASAERRYRLLVRVMARALAQSDTAQFETRLVDALAEDLDCERVSLGLSVGADMRIAAISHSPRVDARNDLVRNIVAAMREAAERGGPLVRPPLAGKPADPAPAHDALVNLSGCDAVISVPLLHQETGVGALILERKIDRPFGSGTLALCESLALLLGPLLLMQHDSKPGCLALFASGLRRYLQQLFGAGHLVVKTVAAGAVAVLSLMALAGAEYRIDATANLQGRIQRVVVAPFDGFVAEASARAGDTVQRGQLLFRLDDRDLKLEQARWSSERAQLLKEQREALAKHDRAAISVIKARIDQADAELALASEKLARTNVTAPLSGLVVSGDLSQSLGSPVERGEILFEVAPVDAYRIMLDVDEREIAHVKPGQRGQLTLASLPDQTHSFIVSRIVPVARAIDGRNLFQVEASLDEAAQGLQPGMRGVGKIDAGEHRLIWIWTHKLVDALRLKFWSWWG